MSRSTDGKRGGANALSEVRLKRASGSIATSATYAGTSAGRPSSSPTSGVNLPTRPTAVADEAGESLADAQTSAACPAHQKRRRSGQRFEQNRGVERRPRPPTRGSSRRRSPRRASARSSAAAGRHPSRRTRAPASRRVCCVKRLPISNNRTSRCSRRRLCATAVPRARAGPTAAARRSSPTTGWRSARSFRQWRKLRRRHRTMKPNVTASEKPAPSCQRASCRARVMRGSIGGGATVSAGNVAGIRSNP